MNTPTVLPNSDSEALRNFGETEHLRQGDVFVTPADADSWIVTDNGRNAVSLSTGEQFISGTGSRDVLMSVCRDACARLIQGGIHLTVGG